MIKEFTRKDAEKIIRQVIASHLGEPMVDDVFKKSVDLLLKDVNGKSFLDVKDDNINIIEAENDNQKTNPNAT